MELWPEGWGIICFAKIPLPHLSSSTVHSRAQNLYKFTFCANHLIAQCKEREPAKKPVSFINPLSKIWRHEGEFMSISGAVLNCQNIFYEKDIAMHKLNAVMCKPLMIDWHKGKGRVLTTTRPSLSERVPGWYASSKHNQSRTSV